MISVTRLNGKTLTVNALFIETVEETPDTILTLTTGKKYVVRESEREVVQAIQLYLQQIGAVRAAIKMNDTEGS